MGVWVYGSMGEVDQTRGEGGEVSEVPKETTPGSIMFVEDGGQLRLVDKSVEQLKEEAGEVECLGMTFPDDNARRAFFLERLRETLKDPEFRAIEGFPIGTDEAILALS